MDETRCPQLENAVGWALYALEPAEEHVLRAHLPGCPVCTDTVRSTEQVAALLGSAVEQYEPPPALRRRVLAALDQATVIELPVRRRGRGLLAAAAAAVLVLGGAIAVLGVQVSHLTAQQQAQAAGEAMARSIVGDPSARRAVLTNAAGQPSAMLVTSRSGAVVIPLDLTPNGANQSYVAWGLLPSGPKALTSFDVPAGGVGPVVVRWPDAAASLTRFAISLEPGRSLPARPTNVIASGSDA